VTKIKDITPDNIPETETQELQVQEDAPPPATQPGATNMLQVIERAAMDPSVDVEKMERLFSLKIQIDAQEAEKAFNMAMMKAQGETRQVSADSRNDQTHSDYASYSAMDKALRPIYTRNGFSLSFGTEDSPLEEHVRVICHVSHDAGHTRKHFIDMPSDGKGAKGNAVMTRVHATGSAVQYGMRYLLKMIFNVATGDDDDDGNAASEACISMNQAMDLEALADEVKANKKNFLKYLRVESFETIPVSKHQAAIEALEEKRKEK
jgi:hypothetical protein